MSNKFFGQFLLEKGLLNSKQLLNAIELQKEANPPIGQLAIKEGFISDAAAVQINMEQQRTDSRFGDLAISMGFMTEEQVSMLFHVQKEIKKFFGEILVEQSYITEAILQQELAEHAELKQTSITEVDSKIKEHKYCQQITDTLDAIIKNFTRIPKIPLQIAQIETQKPTPPNASFIISQTMHVPEPLKVGWIMEKDLMEQVANNFLGIDVTDQEDVYVDAVSEFLNIILGNALVNNGENQTLLDPPIIEPCNADFQGEYNSTLYLTMSAPQKDFSLFFLHN